MTNNIVILIITIAIIAITFTTIHRRHGTFPCDHYDPNIMVNDAHKILGSGQSRPRSKKDRGTPRGPTGLAN